MFEWREIAALTELELLLEIAGEIVMPRELNRGAERRVSLHENLTRCLAAASAPGHLCEKLESAFAGAEIGQMQGEIGVDDSDQRHVGEMQAFRDHLCADEYVDLPGSKVPQGFAIGFLAGHRIRVHSAHRGFGEKLG